MADSERINLQATEGHPIGFFELYAPKKFKNDKGIEGKPKYKATFFMDPASADFKTLVRAHKKLVESFGERDDDDPPLKSPFLSVDKYIAKRERKKPGSGKSLEWAKGLVMVQTSTGEDYPPELLVLKGNDIITLDSDKLRADHKAKFYNGALCYYYLNMAAYDGGNAGVCCYLSKVLTTGKGEKRAGGGGPSGKEVFSGVVGKMSAEDPTDGIDTAEEWG